jgi:LysR family glycine cleavage system transcriptional activator
VASWVGTQALRLMPDEVLPVCSPTLMAGQDALSPEAMAQMPLLQQSTRPQSWRQWFDALGVSAPQALAGPRYELFSMTAAAATQGMGLALVPRLLIDAELARGELVIANAQAAPGDRSYFLVRPSATETPNPTLDAFADWIRAASPPPGAP